ncbi:hypothetical protein KIN20_030254 [Parelaphostrongylus tenuis]|uniref:Uncharacterized protein n=1 Tax=Parelaphostrongylus tenuis TaxID=148309 RepID=A0AAD5WG10_PARTN|nr:hypothetical protein KIN20_030254 [Parelaphostrongylus tenuis]
MGDGIRKSDLWQRSETECAVLHPRYQRSLGWTYNAFLMIADDDRPSTRTFTASGPSNLPIIAVYTENNVIPTRFPGIATSKAAVQAFVQRFAMQTVVDVLEIEGRRALLPDFVISNILGQLQVNTTYEPLRCQILLGPRIFACIFVGSTVTGICPAKGLVGVGCEIVATAINDKHLSLSGTLTTTNIVMANWSRSMWQNVVDRALRMLRSGTVWFAFVHGNGHCQLKLKVNCDIYETNIFI